VEAAQKAFWAVGGSKQIEIGGRTTRPFSLNKNS